MKKNFTVYLRSEGYEQTYEYDVKAENRKEAILKAKNIYKKEFEPKLDGIEIHET